MGSLPVVSEVLPANLNRAFLQGSAYNRIAFFLTSTRGTGRPRSLSAAQERQVFRWINGRDPRQYGLDFGLWTRPEEKSLQ
jgi:hypothetical protein